MNKLLAPNGKPSNLTPEQYKLVRTPEFKAWFGFWDLYAYGKAKKYYEPSVQKIAKELKEEKLSAINEAVDFLSKQVTENDVLIPMPSRYGIAKDTQKLAQKISEKTGAKVFNCLVGKKRESVYEMKKTNQDLSNFDFNFQINCEIPKAKNYFIVDNVIGTGITMKNALQEVIKNVGTNVSPLVFAIDLNNVSKVVDENGEPLVVYHSSNENFNVFSDLYSVGHYFTSKHQVAKTYSDGINILTCFLNIKTPTYWEANCSHWEDVRNVVEKLESSLWWVINKKQRQIVYANREEINVDLQSDGIIIKDIIDVDFNTDNFSYCADTLIVTSSNQIKLADGTNTTFDGNNPDIRFDGGGDADSHKVEFINDRVLINGNDIGLLEFTIKENELEIRRLYLNKENQRIGIGRKIISELFNKNPDVNKIIVYPLGSSIPFWLRFTENVRNDDYFEITKNSLKKGMENYPLKNNNTNNRFYEGGDINNKKQQLNKDMEYNNYAKGGKILGNVILNNENQPIGFNHQEQQKYARIGVTDKYQIQAYIDMGIQVVNFDSVSLNNKLKKSLEELYSTYEDYLISEDSRGIDAFFLAQIRQAENHGYPAEMIEQIRINQTNPESRKQKINEVAEGQKLTLLTWIDYLKQSDYSTEFCYLLFNAILNFNYVLIKNDVVKRTKTTTEGFTPFSASVLAKLYDSNSNYLLKDYIELLAKESEDLLNEAITNEQDGGIWITFLGKGNANDEEIKENAEKLSALVQKTAWCTTSRALSQLVGDGGTYKGGNFYVFVNKTDAGLDPQIAIRMDLDEVGEISGRLDGQYISPFYSEIAIRFCRQNIPNNSGEKYIKMLQYNTRVGDSIKRLKEEGMYPEILSDYAFVVKNKNDVNSRYGMNPNTQLFFDNVNNAISNLPNQYFEANEFSDSVSNLTPTTKYFLGDLTLSQYNNYDLGTSSLVEILGQLNIENNSTSFGQLQKIGGDLIISSPTIQSFDSIEYIGGQIKFTGTNLGLTSFGNLTEYGGTINCITQFTNLIDLGNLVECGDLIIGESSALETTGNLSVAKSILCSSSKNITFPNLVSVLENCDFNKSQTTDLPALQRVGGNFNINSSRLKVFPQLNFIGGNANFGNNFTSTTQNIGRILGDLHLVNSRLKEFTNLTYVKGNIDLKGSLIESLGSIERTDGNIDLSEPNKLKSLGKLEFIGGYFNASGGDIEDMGNVKQIIKFANFGSSKIQSLGNLESVGGSLFLKNSVVNNLGNLIFVGRKIDFGNRADLEAQWNQRTGQNENQNFAVGGAIESQKTGNNATLSISLLTRLLELSNEDLKNDLQIHKVVENISSMSNKELTIDDYNSITNDVNKFATGGQTEAQKEKVSTVMREFKEGKLKTSYGEKVTNPKQAIAIALSEAGIKRKEDGGVLEISAYEGNIPLSLPEHYYSADSDVELVPVVDLMKFREFDRKKTPKYNAENSNYIINSLKESFKNEGIKEPLIIEYSVEDNSVLLIEGNHRLNTAIDMGLMYLPVRVVLRKNKFTPTSKKLSMQVDGIKPNEYGYIPSNLKPSQVGLSQSQKMFVEGGIIEGQLHSECNDETGCGVKFEVGEGGHIIEAERDEAVIVPEAFEINETMTITGTPSQIASALNVLGGGKNFDSGANIESKSFSGKTEQLKPMAKNTDVDYTISNASIIINRRTMADTGIYKAIGTPKQIASAINSMNGNGVEIGEVGKLEKIK